MPILLALIQKYTSLTEVTLIRHDRGRILVSPLSMGMIL